MPAKTNGSPGRGSAKAALRNFTFTKEADAELVRLKTATGKNMTAVLEDLLLQRRQFSAPVEAWLDADVAKGVFKGMRLVAVIGTGRDATYFFSL